METVARIIGGLFILMWLVFIPVNRYYVRAKGVHADLKRLKGSVFQFNILPFLMGVALISTGNLWYIGIGVVCFILSFFFPEFFCAGFPFIAGGYLGYRIAVLLGFKLTLLGAVAGIIITVVVCSIVTAYVVAVPEGSLADQIFHKEMEEERKHNKS